MNDKQICWELLPKVSRSFALCIKMLPAPVSEQMMLSYLIYRVIDTIEDSNAPLPVKKELFTAFTTLLTRHGYTPLRVTAVRGQMLTQLNYTYEKELLEQLGAVLSTYHAQPQGVRSSIRRWGNVMARGMYQFQSKKIDTFKDQDAYSYYVAGVVGYLINDLLYLNKIITSKARKRLHAHSRRFGLALQKVNILRDVSHDVPQGRYYWPRATLAKYGLNYDGLCDASNRDAAMKVLSEEINDSLSYLNSGLFYVLSLPERQLRVRMFCLIPLFMAIESYAKCVNNIDVFDKEKTVKITRPQVEDIVAKSILWGRNNAKLVQWFSSTLSTADPVMAQATTRKLNLKLQTASARKSE